MSTTIDKMMTSNERRAAVLMLLTSMVLLVTLRDALPLSSMALTSTTASRSVENESNLDAEQSVGRIGKNQSDVQEETRFAANSKEARVAKRHLPIYLLQPDEESVSQITWGTVASSWNRTATYTDLIELSTPTAALPSAEGKRPVVMIHCGPKSGR